MSRSPRKKTRTGKTHRRGFLGLQKRGAKRKALRKKDLKPSDLRLRHKIRRRNKLIFKISALVVLVIGLIVGLWKVARMERFLIQKIDVRGVEILKEDQVQAVVENEMSGSVGLFFPRKNSFFVPMTRISKTLKAEFVVVDSISLLRKGTDVLIVIVRERKPETIFCEESAEQISGCYFADKTGVLYRQIPHIARSQFPIIYFSREEKSNLLGSVLLTEKEQQALFLLVKALSDKGDIATTRITLNEDRSFKLNTDKNYSIVIPVEKDYTNIASRFFTSLEAEVFKGEASLSSVEEFDLRFGRKIYYQLKNEEIKTPDSIESGATNHQEGDLDND